MSMSYVQIFRRCNKEVMSGYPRDCKFCGQKIILSEESGRWLPRNLDNTFHECKGKHLEQPQQAQPQPQKKQITLEDIQARLERIEQTLYGSK